MDEATRWRSRAARAMHCSALLGRPARLLWKFSAGHTTRYLLSSPFSSFSPLPLSLSLFPALTNKLINRWRFLSRTGPRRDPREGATPERTIKCVTWWWLPLALYCGVEGQRLVCCCCVKQVFAGRLASPRLETAACERVSCCSSCCELARGPSAAAAAARAIKLNKMLGGEQVGRMKGARPLGPVARVRQRQQRAGKEFHRAHFPLARPAIANARNQSGNLQVG